jgi:tetratricopeptide (TPR) repeat protein
MRARAVLGYVALGLWNWRAAGADFRILRSQNPDSIFTISGLWNYYAIMGFADEALAQWRHLYAINPNEYRNNVQTLWALGRAARFQEAIGVTKGQLVHSPRDTFRLDSLCGAYAATGQIDQARAIEERLDRLQTNSDSISDFQDCQFSTDMATGNRANALRIRHIVESRFPDNGIKAGDIGIGYVQLGEFDKAGDWFERAHERRENNFFSVFFLKQAFAYEKAFEKYRMTPGYRALSQKPLFKEWQIEHDRIAAALTAHRDPLN